MYKKLAFIVFASSLFAGCASVPLESPEASAQAKQFATPAANNAGIYIFRRGGLGKGLKKTIWIDEQCIGETAPETFFYKEVPGGKEYTLATESEFSPNKLSVKTAPGQLYFFEQAIKMGVFVGGAKLKAATEAEGKSAVYAFDLAKSGNCK